MSFIAEKLVKLTIKGKEEYYSESEIIELRDTLLRIYPVAPKPEISITRSKRLISDTWVKDATSYRKGLSASVPQLFVNETFQHFISNPTKEFLILELEKILNCGENKASYALQVLCQEGKIVRRSSAGKIYYKLKQFDYQKKMIDDKTSVVLKQSDQEMFDSLNKSKKLEMIAKREN